MTSLAAGQLVLMPSRALGGLDAQANRHQPPADPGLNALAGIGWFGQSRFGLSAYVFYWQYVLMPSRALGGLDCVLSIKEQTRS